MRTELIPLEGKITIAQGTPIRGHIRGEFFDMLIRNCWVWEYSVFYNTTMEKCPATYVQHMWIRFNKDEMEMVSDSSGVSGINLTDERQWDGDSFYFNDPELRGFFCGLVQKYTRRDGTMDYGMIKQPARPLRFVQQTLRTYIDWLQSPDAYDYGVHYCDERLKDALNYFSDVSQDLLLPIGWNAPQSFKEVMAIFERNLVRITHQMRKRWENEFKKELKSKKLTKKQMRTELKTKISEWESTLPLML